ncbi:MAG: AAA family ATPase, partial [Gemmatimonadota bacterium]|nr:AAA family ATPase [Gemmatimonadota bacterium]
MKDSNHSGRSGQAFSKPSFADWKTAADRLGLKPTSEGLAGPCPHCGDGENRLHIRRDGVFDCRICGDFQGILKSAGFWQDKPTGSASQSRSWDYFSTEGQKITVHRKDVEGKKKVWQSPVGVKLDASKNEKWLPMRRGDGLFTIIVEGEKSCDHIHSVLGDDWTAVTWVRRPATTDWSGLDGALIWPDADEPGRKKAKEIQSLIPNSRILKIPDGKPAGWDCAESEPSEIWEIVNQEPVPEPEPVTPVTPIVWSDIELERIEYVIPYRLERQGLSALIGKPNIGKSNLAVLEIASIAIGRNLLGLCHAKSGEPVKIKQGRVLAYWADEGSPSRLKMKLTARAGHYRLSAEDFDAIRRNVCFA